MASAIETTLAALRNIRIDSELAWEMAIEDKGAEAQRAYEACDDLWDEALCQVEAGDNYAARLTLEFVATHEGRHGDATHAKAALALL